MTPIFIDTEIKHVISTDLAHHYRILPKQVDSGNIELYIDQNNKPGDIKDELELFLGKNVIFHPFPSSEIEMALALFYRKEISAPATASFSIDRNDFLETLFS